MTDREAAALLERNDNILILTHRRPDGDTIGCGAALCLALRQLGKTAWVLPNEADRKVYLIAEAVPGPAAAGEDRLGAAQ